MTAAAYHLCRSLVSSGNSVTWSTVCSPESAVMVCVNTVFVECQHGPELHVRTFPS